MDSLAVLSIVPPILVVILAIYTKSIIFSLLVGVMSGLAIFGIIAPPGLLESSNPIDIMVYGVRLLVESVGTDTNLVLLVFLAMLGGIIAILTAAGCANSFSASASNHIKTKRHAEMYTFLLGCAIFVDDYFNAITVGNVMVSVTDKYKISRAKLAYLIDSTSAPVTILMPVSSWVATVISLIVPELRANGMEQPGMQAFLKSTMFNYYAWFTLVMVLAVIIFDLDLGRMKRVERSFADTGIDESIYVDVNESVVDDMAERKKGSAADMIIILSALVLLTFAFMLFTGDFFNGATIQHALVYCDHGVSLACSALCTMILCFIMFVIRGRITFTAFNDAFVQGVKSMVSAILILVLSWTFSAVLGNDILKTGTYIASVLSSTVSGWILPAIVFVIAAMVSFSTGASWGAMGIMLPTSVALCAAVAPENIYIVLGATLAGSVFGDHCSPLADTTVLSSSAAGCRHLTHVYTQLPYALITAAVCIAAYIISGLCGRAWPGFLFGFAAIFATGFFIGNTRKA